MIGTIILRVAMTASQKTVATVATKVATSAGATLASCLFQNRLIRTANKNIADEPTEENVRKEQGKVAYKSALGAGICGGVGLVAFNAISNVIKNS